MLFEHKLHGHTVTWRGLLFCIQLVEQDESSIKKSVFSHSLVPLIS